MCPVYLPVVSTYCGTITKQSGILLWKCGMCKSMKCLKIRNKCNMVLKWKFYTACGKRVEDANGRNSQIFPCLPSLVHICNGISKSRRETIKKPIMLQLSLVMIHIHIHIDPTILLYPGYHIGRIPYVHPICRETWSNEYNYFLICSMW